MIGLFPGIGAIGGIQASGLEAWQALEKIGGRRGIVYGCDATGELARCPEVAMVSRLRLSLVGQMLARNWNSNAALFWHRGLLTLLPFMRRFRGRVVLFLHGIEAWEKPALLTRILLRRVDRFLSNSQFTWERFLQVAPEFRAVPHSVVHLGMGEPLTSDLRPPTSDLSSSVPAAVIIGRLAREEDYKGHRESDCHVAGGSRAASRRPNYGSWATAT